MKTNPPIFAALLACIACSTALSMTKNEHAAQKDIIAGEYKVSRDKCNSLKANAKEICVSEAKGVLSVAKAELKSAYEPSARHTEKVAMAKGDAAYDTAKEKCDDSQGNAKSICRADAKAMHVKAQDEARVTRVNAEADKVRTGARSMADKDENKASLKAALARCDSMMGAAKDTCMTDAKFKHNVK